MDEFGIYPDVLVMPWAGALFILRALPRVHVKEEMIEKPIQPKIRGLTARRVLSTLTDDEVDLAFAAIDTPSILRVIAKEGDIDYPSRLIAAFLAQRTLWPRLLSLISTRGGSKKIEEITQNAFAAEE